MSARKLKHGPAYSKTMLINAKFAALILASLSEEIGNIIQRQLTRK
jgi:hypothetical protein